ncbi:choice-of-anchor D domain-containing protein [Myxococcota bacterium]|nr:choice-of-anchor D domain-containing protein [Myxococcota bacterium]
MTKRFSLETNSLGAVALLWALAAGAALAGCDDKFSGSGSPDITVTPTSISFGKVNIGENVDEFVRVQNSGDGTLVITGISMNMGDTTDYELYWNTENEADTAFVGITRNGENRFDLPLQLEPRTEFFLILNYAPTDDTPESGEIVLTTNVGDKRTVTIPVGTASVAPEITVSPGTHDFGSVPAFNPNDPEAEPEFVDVTVTNIGQLPLTNFGFSLSGSQEFEPLIGGRDPRRESNAALLDDPDEDGEAGLSPNASFVIRVEYKPSTQGPDAAQLIIESNDPVQPSIAVALTANGATPCINVVPAAVEFPASLVNRDDSRPVNIESCGGGPLQIESIEIAPGSDPAFALDATSLPTFPAVLPAATPEQALPSREIRVSFTPREERVYNGKLIVRTNDPSSPEKIVSLLGRGVLNACPQARANPEEHYVEPLDVVVLDGASSVDPDGPDNRPVRFEWVITDRPEGSTQQPREQVNGDDPTIGAPDDLTTPNAQFFVDLAGTYTAELRVTDNLGLSSETCETSAIVTIVAKPEEAIHIQVVWTSPDDPDQTDRQGTDVDLHLRHPTGDWFLAPGDCYYGNPNPDWGELTLESDNPVLDIDDINGAGPENINLNEPENTETLGAPYEVAVHYYSSRERQTGQDYGASTATARIFLQGALNLTVENIELPAQDAFCKVAAIEWPAATSTSILECFDTKP